MWNKSFCLFSIQALETIIHTNAQSKNLCFELGIFCELNCWKPEAIRLISIEEYGENRVFYTQAYYEQGLEKRT